MQIDLQKKPMNMQRDLQQKLKYVPAKETQIYEYGSAKDTYTSAKEKFLLKRDLSLAA